jgi:hypothetical protein
MRSLVVPVALGLVGACVTSAPPPHPATVRADALALWAGCYDVRLGLWSPTPSDFEVPALLRLDRSLGPLGQRPAIPDVRWKSHTFRGYWRPFGADSVVVSWTNKLWGLALALRVEGDSLTGRVWEVHDVGGPAYPSAQISGRRVACPSAMPLR